jgi:flagellar biosynthesis/type III secretory pathway protein FliH
MLVGLKLDPARTQLISGFVDTYLRLNKDEQKEFQAELEKTIPAAKEEVMEIVTSWMEEGIEKGLEQGLIQGKREGEMALVMRLLNRRVGEVPTELEQKIGGLEVAQLEELGLALLDFSSLNDLENWLQSHAV